MPVTRMIVRPSVYLIGTQTVCDTELDRFLKKEGVDNWETDTEVGGQKLAEVGGRLCYMSFAKPRPGGNKAYINHILDVQHGSVLEHAVYTLLITGVSRSLTHELVRHRAGISPSQLSQRFVDEGGTSDKPLDIVVPPLIQDFDIQDTGTPEELAMNHRIAQLWSEFMDDVSRIYHKLDDLIQLRLQKPDMVGRFKTDTERRKAAREAARSVLPNATETKVMITANARALRWMITLRGTAAADAEFRNLSIPLLQTLQGHSPNIFGDMHVDTVEGIECIVAEHPKV